MTDHVAAALLVTMEQDLQRLRDENAALQRRLDGMPWEEIEKYRKAFPLPGHFGIVELLDRILALREG